MMKSRWRWVGVRSGKNTSHLYFDDDGSIVWTLSFDSWWRYTATCPSLERALPQGKRHRNHWCPKTVNLGELTKLSFAFGVGRSSNPSKRTSTASTFTTLELVWLFMMAVNKVILLCRLRLMLRSIPVATRSTHVHQWAAPPASQPLSASYANKHEDLRPYHPVIEMKIEVGRTLHHVHSIIISFSIVLPRTSPEMNCFRLLGISKHFQHW